MHAIPAALAEVERIIAQACERAGRARSDITCVAVSKFHGVDAITEAMSAGVRDFGENYVQEWRQKHEQLADKPVQWHFIGTLQRNKARWVAGEVALIHAVDSLALASDIAKHARAKGRRQRVLVAVHLGGEATKTGVEPDALPGFFEALAPLHADGGIEVMGLMTMPPPAAASPDGNRQYFVALRSWRDRLRSNELPLPWLSMGMSDDYPIAIEEGATHVRIGTAIFGARGR